MKKYKSPTEFFQTVEHFFPFCQQNAKRERHFLAKCPSLDGFDQPCGACSENRSAAAK